MGVVQCKYRPSDSTETNLSRSCNIDESTTDHLVKSIKINSKAQVNKYNTNCSIDPQLKLNNNNNNNSNNNANSNNLNNADIFDFLNKTNTVKSFAGNDNNEKNKETTEES